MAGRRARDREADGWESTDFPVVCETCLGPNPYVRMTRAEYGKECKVCSRPFTVFRWRPGPEARFKKTEICRTCARAKGVCQTCILDLDYNVPVQVRDAAAGAAPQEAPRSAVHREWHAQQLERLMAEEDAGGAGAGAAGALLAAAGARGGAVVGAGSGAGRGGAGGKERPGEGLNKLQRHAPYYERNRAKICSFFVKGTCTRGAECPFRHELPKHGANDPLSNQNLQDRYYGTNDPVAEKMLKRAEAMPGLEPPADASVCTLYVGGLGPRVGARELREHFAEDGAVLDVRVVPGKLCAFVAFAERRGAEAAASRHREAGLVVAGQRLRVAWANQPDRRPGAPAAAPVAGPPGPARPPPGAPGAPAGPPPGALYPSMDPAARGGALPPPAGGGPPPPPA